jgi:hypothetical protein
MWHWAAGSVAVYFATLSALMPLASEYDLRLRRRLPRCELLRAVALDCLAADTAEDPLREVAAQVEQQVTYAVAGVVGLPLHLHLRQQ